MKLLIVLITMGFIGIIGAIDQVEAHHANVIIVPILGSGNAGCQDTREGCYNPLVAKVDVGSKVIFSNTDTVAHVFAAGTIWKPTGEFDSGLVNPGTSFEWTPTKVGEVQHFCTVHPWQSGTIIVHEKGTNFKNPPQLKQEYSKTATYKGLDKLSGEISVGVLVGQSGDLSAIAEEIVSGFNKAEADFNEYLAESGEDWTLKLVIEDTQTNPVIALEKATSFNAKGIGVIVGPITSANVQNIKGYADANNILIISPGSTSPTLALPNDSVYRTIPDDTKQGTAIANVMYDQGIRAIAMIHRADAWGDGLQKTTSENFESLGGIVADPNRYNPTTHEYSVSISVLAEQVKTLVDQYGADKVGVSLIGFAESLQIMKAASQYDILSDVRWFGTDANTNDIRITQDMITSEFTNAVQFATVQFAIANNPITENVRADVVKDIGRNPGVYTFTSYDAVWLAGLSILEAQSTNPAYVKCVIHSVAADRVGASGANTLNAAGDLATADYDIWGVPNGKWSIIDKYVSTNRSDIRSANTSMEISTCINNIPIHTKIDTTDSDLVETVKKVPNIDKSRFKLAPDIIGITDYINITPEQLDEKIKDSVVLYDIRTYSCINCIRTLPYITVWDEKYAEQGLLIIGIHTSEFESDSDLDSIKTAVTKYNISYPLVLDNNKETWNAFENRHQLRKYIADHEGYIRYDHVGEGAYKEMEDIIRQLLKERADSFGMKNEVNSKTMPKLNTHKIVNIYNNTQSQLDETETIYNLKRQLTEAYTQYNSTIVHLETQYNDLQSRYNTLETQYNELQTRYNNLESQPSTKSDLSNFQTRYNILETQYNDLQSQYNKQQNKTDQLMNKINTKTDNKNIWKERHTICFEKKENLKYELETTTQELNQYKLDIIDNENQCNDMLNDHETQITTLEGNITEYKLTIEKLKQEKADLIKKVETLETQLSEN